MGVHAYSHIATHTSSSSLPSFRPHISAGDPALTWLTKIPVLFPPTIVISSARLARLFFGEVDALKIGELWGILKDMEVVKTTEKRQYSAAQLLCF